MDWRPDARPAALTRESNEYVNTHDRKRSEVGRVSREVLVPQTEASVLYHGLDCRVIDRGRAYRMAQEDAEEVLGRRPAPCLRPDANGPDPDGRREVPA